MSTKIYISFSVNHIQVNLNAVIIFLKKCEPDIRQSLADIVSILDCHLLSK